MAWSIVRQPNGNFARFSDIVDDFTNLDMTEAEALELCKEKMSHEDAIKKVRSGIDDIKYWTKDVKGTGLERWSTCLETIAKIHGQERASELINKFTNSDD